MEKLKATLLSMENFVLDNLYLDKYVSLIFKNLTTKKEKFTHQIHHIVPVSYFKSNQLEIDNSSQNKVSLTHEEHLLAHYFLTKCCATQRLRLANASAIKFILASDTLSNLVNVENLKDIFDYQALMEMVNKEKSDNYKGTKCIHLGDIDKRVPIDQLNQYLADGWLLGRSPKVRQKISKGSFGKPGTMTGKHLSEAVKRKISKGNSGGKYIFKGDEIKHIKETLLQKYLDAGWKLGNPANGKKIGKTIWVHNNVEAHLIKILDLDTYLNAGYTLGRKIIK